MAFSLKHSRIFSILILFFIPWSVYQLTTSTIEFLVIPFIIIFVYFYTDILSGILHVVLDNERSLNVPIVKGLAKGFQSHHRNPTNIYTMTLYNHLYTMHLPLVAIFPIVLLINHPHTYVIYLCLVVSLHAMQMSHRWAHTPRKLLSPGVIFLQRTGFLLKPLTHGKHHNNVFDTNFCIMNGWFNFPLNHLVKIFGRTSHGWLVCFILVSILMLILPLLFT